MSDFALQKNLPYRRVGFHVGIKTEYIDVLERSKKLFLHFPTRRSGQKQCFCAILHVRQAKNKVLILSYMSDNSNKIFSRHLTCRTSEIKIICPILRVGQGINKIYTLSDISDETIKNNFVLSVKYEVSIILFYIQ